MKHFRRNLLVLLCVILTGIGQAFAQTEVTVEPGLNTLTNAVAAYPGATLILKRGGDYVVDNPVVLAVPTIIMGEKEPAETKPAVVSFFAEPGEAGDKRLFAIGANCTIKDLGLMGYTKDNQHIGPIIKVNRDNITIIINGCVIQGAKQITEANVNNGLTIIQKNNIIFNLFKVRWDSWGGWCHGVYGDSTTYLSYNNTFFMCESFFNILNYGTNSSELMDHNTYCNTWGETFYPSYIRNYEVKNSIFFNTYIRGYVGIRLDENGNTLWDGDWIEYRPEIGITDTLCGDVAIYPNEADSTKSRNVFLTNNLKKYDQKVLDFYAANNVTPQTFFNVSGYKFAERYKWVIKDNFLQENGNAIDPQFAMGEIPESAYENMFKQRKETILPSSQGPGYPYDLAWRPGGEEKGEFIWPLPFNLKPMNQAILTAGCAFDPLGKFKWCVV